jgi:hypothetical protein
MGSGGHSQAAPRTPDESPCSAFLTGVAKLSEKTWPPILAGNCA